MLAFDVSSSMTATDLTPDADGRREGRGAHRRRAPTAHRAGRRRRVRHQRARHPAADRGPGERARRDRPPPAGGGTALGSGLQTSLSAITGKTVLVDAPGTVERRIEPQGPDLGYHGSAAVVLFSDGENTAEPDPVDVAELASSAGVRVYPVGIGSPAGHRDRGRRVPARDRAGRADAAHDRRRGPTAATSRPPTRRRWPAWPTPIDLEWKVETEHIEVTALLAAAAGLLVLAGFGLSLALVRAGRLMGFTWPLALLALLAVPLLAGVYVGQLRRRRRQAVRYSSVALIKAAAAAAGGLEAARARRAAPGRPRRARPGRGPAARECRRAGLGVGPDPGARRVGVDVRDGRRAQPAHRGAGGGARLRAGPGRSHAHRPGPVRRLRPGRGGADDGPRSRCCRRSTR